MPCTTILVGKKASNDGSTMIARNDDGGGDVKKLIVVDPKHQPRKYKTVISHLTIELPDNPLRYTSTPSVDGKYGIWPANGINSKNVAMTATETITSNPRVLSGDPMVKYDPKTKTPGGIGEEDLVLLVLPYISSAREGVIRLGELLEKYGTYEANGIAFSDKDECWWLETIGGHHFIARKVQDNEIVIMPNQLGIDKFDMDDAFGKQESHICSKDLKEFIKDNNLDVSFNGIINPRDAFGSHSDADHVYNTPRGWYMARYFLPTTYKWDGPDAYFTPESDDIPWSLVPEKKVTLEDIKYILSSHYQGTPYDPYLHKDTGVRGKYRPIGVSRTEVMAILQIRNDVPSEIAPIEWICFGPNPFNTLIPVYTNVDSLPRYLSKVESTRVSTDNFYWSSLLLGVIADNNYDNAQIWIERYQMITMIEGRKIVKKYDKGFIEKKDNTLLNLANKEACKEIQKHTDAVIKRILQDAIPNLKCCYKRTDN